jgi:hypothetical protein
MIAEQKSVFYWPLIGTAALLLLATVGNLVSEEVNWGALDYLIGASLVFVVMTVEMFLWRSLPKKSRWPVMLFLFLLFGILWAEMAVGIFGSPLAGS